MKQKGFFICIEGLDGCGKTTQAKLLVRSLRKIGYDAVCTAEPSRGKVGVFIRRNFLDSDKRHSVVVEALLFAADRVDHVKNEISPALNEGKIVVSDRYLYSSLAYQGAGGLGLEWIELINRDALRPGLALFLDVAPEAVMRRLKRRKSVMENLGTQRKVRKVYLRFAEEGKLVKIDGKGSRSEVASAIVETVLKALRGPD